MKVKKVLMAGLCLVALAFASCSNMSELEGTKWKGEVLETTVTATFSEKSCTIATSGYVIGNAAGTYETSKSNVIITVKTTSGSFDGQLEKGDVIRGTYNLNKGYMYISLFLYGKEMEFFLDKVN